MCNESHYGLREKHGKVEARDTPPFLASQSPCRPCPIGNSIMILKVNHARNNAPIFFPMMLLAPSNVTANNAMAHTPKALAISSPSPKRSYKV